MPRSKFKFGLLTRLSVIAFVLLLLAFSVGRPLLHAVAEWRARQHLDLARAGMTQGEWAQAAQAITDARGILPGHAEVLRVTAVFLDETRGDPHLLMQTLRQLEQAGHAEEGDALLNLRALLSARRHAEARQAFALLKPAQRSRPEALLIEAQLLREEGNTQAASDNALRAHAMQPEREDAVLALAISQSWNTPYEVQSAAIQRLWTLAEAKTPAALGAIQHLAAQPYATLPQAEKLLRLAEAHPLCQPATRLAVVSTLMRKAPDRRAVMLDAEVARYRGSKNNDLAQAAFWLASESEHDRLLEICPMRVALESEELFRVVALSLAHQQRWKELRRLITEERVPAAAEQINVWLAWADGFLEPDMKKARLQLESTIRQGKKTASLEVIRSAAEVAEIHGLWDLALDCHAFRGQQAPENEVSLLEKSYEIARQQADGQGMLTIACRLRALRPTSVIFSERAAYLALLLGAEMESSLSASQGVSPSRRAFLAALVAHRFKDMATVAKELAEVTDTRAFQPGERAVYAGLLALAGQTAAGFQIAEKISEALLLAEEKQFLKLAK